MAMLGRMLLSAFALLASADQHVLKSEHSAASVRKQLRKAEIIPTVIDDFVPLLALDAEWSSGHAELGNTLNPNDLDDAPTVALSHLHHHGTHHGAFVVVLTDPDAPSRKDPKWSEMCHWIVLADGSEVMPYKAPGPPEGTGKHRYVFVALAPENGTAEIYPSKPGDRQHWGYDSDDGETRGVRDWAKDNGLVPIAANFIYAEHQ
ncbi:phosphatidylethanolamine-binding protein [Echria macrotheca]|uniref:Phosphatidylethanolamine-binding protein n=1 Tax=Echria macrotheca TaxID=438768 RepID=A0AAJ0F2Z9_9PEZI|nr:phosphatidylethanolamine-binding protein [Echria macrotheca]